MGNRQSTLILVIGLSWLLPSWAPADEGRKPPNIVLIMADDLGYSDLGCYGGEIKTPNLDKLAAGGLRFTNFFNTARCCPTRASLLTGLYPHQAGVGHMVSQDTQQPGYRGEINRRCITIAELLRAAGYGTYMVGKWHLTLEAHIKGQVKDSWPRQRGFERFFGTLTGAGSFYRPTTLTRDNEPIEAPNGFYYTDAISDHAITFVREHRQQRAGAPFFCYVAYTAPHWPLHALKEDIARYRDVYQQGWDSLRQERHARMKKLGLVAPAWKVAPRDKEIPAWQSLEPAKKDEMAHKMAVYAAMVDRMDQGIGRLVAALKEQGVLDDTLLLFLADNGGCAEGGLFGFERQPGGQVGEDSSFASYGQGWAWLSNAVFRLYKHWVHGGGVSSPLIVHWPARLREPGALRQQPGHLIDILATCADVAGAKYPKEFNGQAITPLEGKSLLPAFDNRPLEREAIYWEHEGNKGILAGQWKLVSRHPGPWELYDLQADRGETTNLAAAQPERAQALAGQWQRWAERCQVLPLLPWQKQGK